MFMDGDAHDSFIKVAVVTTKWGLQMLKLAPKSGNCMIDSIMMQFGIIGGLGGLLRASVGARKAFLKKRKFKPNYFLATVIGAILIGMIVGATVGINNAVALFAGYAGTDLLEGLAKSFKLAPIRIG